MDNNNYLWQEFNIKTFPAETIVFKDGVFMPEISTLKSTTIDKKYGLPVHIIYVGEISDKNNLNIDILVAEQDVFLTVKIQNKKPAFLNIFVKNAGKKSFFKGMVLAQNFSKLEINNYGYHIAPNTGIIIMTKIVAHINSCTILNGTAEIEKNCHNCDSNIGFSALASKNAKIEFFPAQLIYSPPTSAEHSASIYKGTTAQIEYLRESGLSEAQTQKVLSEAFINDMMLF